MREVGFDDCGGDGGADGDGVEDHGNWEREQVLEALQLTVVKPERGLL